MKFFPTFSPERLPPPESEGWSLTLGRLSASVMIDSLSFRLEVSPEKAGLALLFILLWWSRDG